METGTFKIPNIYTRYDINVEVTREKGKMVTKDTQFQKLAEHVLEGNESEVVKIVKELLKIKNPINIINDGLITGMKEVSKLWEDGSFFLPQVILSSDAMVAGIALCEEKMGKLLEKKGKVVTHTAEGDIHDIGQVIVNALLNAAGFEVINLGADVSVDAVVEACRLNKPIMVTGTALMTTTMSAFPRIAERLKQENINIPFVCGGGAVNEDFVSSFDFGIWGKDASQAPAMAEDALNGMDWKKMRAKWNG